MGQIALQIPVSGLANQTEDPKVASDLTTIQTLVNGNLDATNIADSLAQTAGVNTSDQTVKGAVNITASQSTSSTSYALLATPDQVSGLVLPANGLIELSYQATWQESVGGAARAAIFLNSNQLKIAYPAAPVTSAAMTNAGGSGINRSLVSFAGGLLSPSDSNGADVTTGQAVGVVLLAGTSPTNAFEVGGVGAVTLTSSSLPASGPSGAVVGGLCRIFAAAGTYAVSVKFKASSGSVTASNRKLWVRALSFA